MVLNVVDDQCRICFTNHGVLYDCLQQDSILTVIDHRLAKLAGFENSTKLEFFAAASSQKLNDSC